MRDREGEGGGEKGWREREEGEFLIFGPARTE